MKNWLKPWLVCVLLPSITGSFVGGVIDNQSWKTVLFSIVVSTAVVTSVVLSALLITWAKRK